MIRTFLDSYFFKFLLVFILAGCSQNYVVDVSKPGQNPLAASGENGASINQNDGKNDEKNGDTGGGSEPPTLKNITQVFLSSQTQKVDILFVIDNSGSMYENQVALKQNLQTFINQFSTKNIDFRIGAISTDSSILDPKSKISHLSPGKRYLEKNSPNLIVNFQSMVDIGINGSGNEIGITKSIEAISNSALVNNLNSGFIRTDAFLNIIYLSDEDESCVSIFEWYTSSLCRKEGSNYYQTGTKLSSLLDSFENLLTNIGKNAPANLKIDSIVHLTPPTYNQDPDGYSGIAYSQAALRFGGSSYSILQNFSTHLANIGTSISGINIFQLNQVPYSESSIIVKLDGIIIKRDDVSGYTYNPVSKTISFKGSAYNQLISSVGQSIEVSYDIISN